MNRVCVGIVAGAHGLSGLLKVKSFTEKPEDIETYGPLSNAQGDHHWTMTIKRQDKNILLARFDGIGKREDADALAGTRLFVDRSALPPPNDPESYYHADLIGLQVKQDNGRMIGIIRAVHNFGAGDILDIQSEDGGSLDLPFTRQWVPKIDLLRGFMVVTPPPGLWDNQPSNPEDPTASMMAKKAPMVTKSP